MVPHLSDEHLNEPILKFARNDCVRVLAHHTVAQALESVQKSEPSGRIIYFYAVDEQDRLQGVVPTRRLLLSRPGEVIRDIMVTNVVAVPDTATLLDACDLFLFHRLLALPIVDGDRRLLGVVDVELYTEEMSDLARQEEYNDIFQLIGVHVSELRQASTAVIFRNRFPWLLANILGGLACALIAGIYEGVLERVVALALFIPVVLALAESVSIQSLTLTLQAQHGKGKRAGIPWSQVLRETPVGMMLGVACGVIVATASLVWQRHAAVAACLLLSILLSITLATLYGLLVPTVLRSIQRDPKVASGPVTLALTDLSTLACYLTLATWLLGK